MTDREIRAALESASEKLTVLGTTEAVGLAMVAQGIKAQPGCPSLCVLAQWFREELSLGEDFRFDVNGKTDDWRVEILERHGWDCVDSVRLAPHVGLLAAQFDAGQWPQLEVGG